MDIIGTRKSSIGSQMVFEAVLKAAASVLVPVVRPCLTGGSEAD